MSLPPMRAGVGTPEGRLYPNDVHVIQRAVGLAAVVTTRAAETAITVAEHQGRTGKGSVGAAHVHAAMRHQAMTVMTSEGLEEDVDNLTRELWESSDDGNNDDGPPSLIDSDDAFSDCESSTTEQQPPPPPQKGGYDDDDQLPPITCVCEVCVAVKRALEGWDAWAPADPVERYMKHLVDTHLA